MAVEHNFARGDILKKVLDRVGLAAKRPLNLRRGGLDQAASANLLRRARSFSQIAGQLSAKLDDLIEFKYPAPVLESSWRKWKKPSRKTFGTILRRYGGETPRGGRLDKLGNTLPLSRKLPTIVFRPPSPTAPSFHSGEYHDTPKWINKDIKKARDDISGLSTIVDNLVNFQDPRPRNLQGEFQPQGEGGPDPNAMARVYKMPQPQSGPSATQGAGAALVGGALGAVGGNIGKTSWAASRKAIKHLAKRQKTGKIMPRISKVI